MNKNNNNTNDTITLSRAEYEALLTRQAIMEKQQAVIEKQNAELLKQKAKLEHQVDYFMEQLRISMQSQYGKSSEKIECIIYTCYWSRITLMASSMCSVRISLSYTSPIVSTSAARWTMFQVATAT